MNNQEFSMTETGVFFRIFFDKPPMPEPLPFIQKAIEAIPGVSHIDIAVPYRTARFQSAEVDSKQVKAILSAQGVTVVSVHRSP
jgi:hypothetical protein